jgi:5'-nucleotidase
LNGPRVSAAALVALAALAGPTAAGAPRTVIVSIVGTNDLHGRIEALPTLGGYLANLRRARARDGGAVVLVDAGDAFQGTLESNLGEGAAVVRGYNALRYDAMAIGNHEFDFGAIKMGTLKGSPSPPAMGSGERSSPSPDAIGADPRGALKARAREAHFPFLAANVVDAASGQPVRWPNVRPTVLVDVAGVKIGLIGVTTMSTPRTTLAANFVGLGVTDIATTAVDDARALRADGAAAVVLVAHAGGGCTRLDDPDDLASCDPNGEIFQVARALPAAPPGGPPTVDAVVAGHTHDGVAQRVAGIPVVEAFAEGRDFDRIDLTIDRDRRRVVSARIFPPQRLCAPARCADERYEGAPVVPDAAVARAIAPDLTLARARREASLGVTVTASVPRANKVESPLGNLFTDLMRAARPDADVALTNGGGLRADLPPGPLTYGRLYEAAPFDNRFATLPLTGADLARVVARNLGRTNGIVSLSGVRAVARCAGGELDVALERPDGRKVAPGERLVLVTSDFLATGGDGLFPEELRRAATLDGGLPIRDEMARVLRARGGQLAGDAPALYDPARPRLVYPGPRPVACAPAPPGR